MALVREDGSAAHAKVVLARMSKDLRKTTSLVPHLWLHRSSNGCPSVHVACQLQDTIVLNRGGVHIHKARSYMPLKTIQREVLRAGWTCKATESTRLTDANQKTGMRYHNAAGQSKAFPSLPDHGPTRADTQQISLPTNKPRSMHK
jgi:hypothetical protein